MRGTNTVIPRLASTPKSRIEPAVVKGNHVPAMLRTGTIFILLASPQFAAVNPRVEYAFGILDECRGANESAATHFETARLADPAARPLVERGVARMLAADDRAGAIRLFRELAAARPDDLPAQLAYADFLASEGRGDALATKLAVETLDASLAKHPGDPEIIRRLSSLDRSRTQGLLDMLAADDPASVMLHATLSKRLLDEDDAAVLAEIDRRFLSASEAHPEDPVLARSASEHFRNTQRLDQAIDVLKRHTGSAPWSLDLRVRLGVLNFSAKRDADGETTLKEVLVIHPRHALAHQSLAKFYQLRNKPEPAAYHSGELLKIRGGAPSEFIKLADAHLTNGRAREARILLEKAVFNHPDNPELRMKLAIATHRDPETRTRAARMFREAESAATDGKISDPAFLTASAEALIESGQGKAGEERLRAAIRAYPPDAKKETAAALRRLASLWTAENRNAEAARALNLRADSLDPKP
jgi:predicted Zn-dependent protease